MPLATSVLISPSRSAPASSCTTNTDHPRIPLSVCARQLQVLDPCRRLAIEARHPCLGVGKARANGERHSGGTPGQTSLRVDYSATHPSGGAPGFHVFVTPPPSWRSFCAKSSSCAWNASSSRGSTPASSISARQSARADSASVCWSSLHLSSLSEPSALG